MPQPFRAAVIGTGFIGPVHVEGLRRAGVEVGAIVGSTPEKSKQAQDRLHVDSAHRTLEDVLSDPTIDAVHITTPNRLHFEQAVATLQAGKHVLCEKPLAMNTKQSAELVALAAAGDRAAGVAYNIRYYPLCHEAADRVARREMGDVFHVTGSYVQDWLLRDTDFNWRVESKEGGELRAVADIGTHWLDLIQFILGRHVVAVCADLRTVHTERQRPGGSVETFSEKTKTVDESTAVPIDTEDCGSVLLRFEGNVNGSLWVSQTTAGRKNCLRFELGGSRQALAWNSEQPNTLWLGRRDEPNGQLIRDPALLGERAAPLAQYPGGHNEGFPDTFKQLFRSFYGYLADGDMRAPAPFPTFADGHQEVRLCEAILRSHRQQGWIDLDAEAEA